MNMKKSMVLAAVAGLMLAAPVFARFADDQPKAAAAPAPISWSDPQFAKIADMLSGTWKTTKPVAQGDNKDATSDVFIGVAPVRFTGLTDTLYFETARADAVRAPFRQGIWQLYKNHKGETRLRTLEFRRTRGEFYSTMGAWAAPQTFPTEVAVTDLIGTLDLKLSLSGDTLTGKTPYPYPTGTGGAVEMTSEIKVTKDTFSSMDRGFGADGKVAWGPASGDMYTFARVQSPVDVKQSDDGLVTIDYRGQATGDPTTPGWRVAFQYVLSLGNGEVLESSRARAKPYTVRLGDPMPAGIARGLEGIRQGDFRRVIVPPALGFGEAGNPRAKIPPNATLYYEIECVATEPPAPDAKPDAANDGSVPVIGGAPQMKQIEAPPFKVDPKIFEPKKVDPANPPK